MCRLPWTQNIVSHALGLTGIPSFARGTILFFDAKNSYLVGIVNLSLPLLCLCHHFQLAAAAAAAAFAAVVAADAAAATAAAVVTAAAIAATLEQTQWGLAGSAVWLQSH